MPLTVHWQYDGARNVFSAYCSLLSFHFLVQASSLAEDDALSFILPHRPFEETMLEPKQTITSSHTPKNVGSVKTRRHTPT